MPSHTSEIDLRRMIAQYAQTSIPRVFAPQQHRAARALLMRLVDESVGSLYAPPRRILADWVGRLGLDPKAAKDARRALCGGFTLLIFDLRRMVEQPGFAHCGNTYRDRRPIRDQMVMKGRRSDRNTAPRAACFGAHAHNPLAAQLRRAMHDNDDTLHRLRRAVAPDHGRLTDKTLLSWSLGYSAPRDVASLEILARIEIRYGLTPGLLRQLSPLRCAALKGLPPRKLRGGDWNNERWHLPDNFVDLAPQKQAEIREWIEKTLMPGCTTPFRAWHRAAALRRYAVPLTKARALVNRSAPLGRRVRPRDQNPAVSSHARLDDEVCDLLAFKMGAFCPIGFGRVGRWGAPTAMMNLRRFESVFGTIVRHLAGLGPPHSVELSLGYLVHPGVWDRYLKWRFSSRGFYTAAERDLLGMIHSLCKRSTGWLRQRPDLALDLRPIPGLAESEAIVAARTDWDKACDAMVVFTSSRGGDLAQMMTIHRDPFEAIDVVLSEQSPLDTYLTIPCHIVRHIPTSPRYAKTRAELYRTLIMFHLAVHTGFRQRNIRELLLCRPGGKPKSESELQRLKRGELRYVEAAREWRILIPTKAFKNANSSFFNGRALEITLPDQGDIYAHLERYISVERGVLLGPGHDPGTVLVNRSRRNAKLLEMSKGNLYSAWSEMIMRFGIHNPYTGRGAIAGLLPHGPHAVRDLLATHVLKQTGSFELAGYAIQDSPATIMRHYGRFAPTEKARLAAEVIQQSWGRASGMGDAPWADDAKRITALDFTASSFGPTHAGATVRSDPQPYRPSPRRRP